MKFSHSTKTVGPELGEVSPCSPATPTLSGPARRHGRPRCGSNGGPTQREPRPCHAPSTVNGKQVVLRTCLCVHARANVQTRRAPIGARTRRHACACTHALLPLTHCPHVRPSHTCPPARTRPDCPSEPIAPNSLGTCTVLHLRAYTFPPPPRGPRRRQLLCRLCPALGCLPRLPRAPCRPAPPPSSSPGVSWCRALLCRPVRGQPKACVTPRVPADCPSEADPEACKALRVAGDSAGRETGHGHQEACNHSASQSPSE
jgi:hypothetical protein